jgi:parvulin-like peptidyl-prolyl isomerase
MRKTQTSYRARHILLEDIEDAEDVLEKLADGESFEQLAREVSECESGKNGGDLGVFYTGDMVPEFERALYHMEVGEVSKPVKSKYGFHIIEKLEV